MKTIIRNFTSIFRKFVTANLLNLLGLSLAFASFFVIMMQGHRTSRATASNRDGPTSTSSWWTIKSIR